MDKSGETTGVKFPVLSWNIEGWKRNCFNLQHFINMHNPVLVFLSEPQLYHCDISSCFQMFSGEFSFNLNSEDVMCPDLPLISRAAKGGTMVMWRSELSPFVKILPTSSPAVLPVLLSIPGLAPTVHISLYLPTSGRDAEFLSALAALEASIVQVSEDFACPIYLRGDCNVNLNNTARANLFQHFTSKLSLSSLDLNHPTHHHFTGNGASDSQLDLLLYMGPHNLAETLTTVVCSLTNPLVDSHHDVILSAFPLHLLQPDPCTGNISAPRVLNQRVKVKWSTETVPLYESLVSPSLISLRERWSNSPDPTSFSILIESTYSALNIAAKSTHKTVDLSRPHHNHSTVYPEIKLAQSNSVNSARALRLLLMSPTPEPAALESARLEASASRATLRKITRDVQKASSRKRDELLASVLDRNPSELFKSIRALKTNSSSDIKKLSVNNKIYTGEAICDGFYDSLSALKEPDMSPIHSSESYARCKSDVDQITKICQAGVNIPHLPVKSAEKLLKSLKPDVNDLYSITPRHFINAGCEGITHFAFLVNTIIENVNLSSLDSLNSVWAMVLFKGHGKDRESHRSYRTISTCPLLSKALDKHIGALFESGWAAAQAETQFQGTGSSHELAALLLTETIQFSLFHTKQPIFVLLLDAQSAFDKILRELCIRAAYLAGSHGQGLNFINNRLENRKTFPEFSKVIMGPISDKLGVEQGGVLSDRLYKLANNAELILTQQSDLGVYMCTCSPSILNTPVSICDCVHVASVGQADDVALVSNDPFRLQGLVHLAMQYAKDYHITMVPEKTKLLCYTPKGQELNTQYWESVSPVHMNGLKIPFSKDAEHVGILRSTTPGCMASLLARMTAHTRAVFSVLPAGLGRGHSGNCAGALRVKKLYGLPVLLSGLAALVLSKTEQESLNHHHKVQLERLQRLYPSTPEPVVFFLAGALPASATLHLRQLSLLCMIGRLGPESILHRHGRQILAAAPPEITSHPNLSSHSWFVQVRQLTERYALPDPLMILAYPPSREEWKKTTRLRVTEHWAIHLRAHASSLPSLNLFRASHMSLSCPSPIWSSCYSSQYEVKKAVVQARMGSGRYRTCWLRRHWAEKESGACRVPGCSGDTPGTLLHLATGQCPGLAAATAAAAQHWCNYTGEFPFLLPLLQEYARADPNVFLGFLLDPSTQPPVISLAQEVGRPVIDQLCHLTRTWLFMQHKERLKKLGLWQ